MTIKAVTINPNSITIKPARRFKETAEGFVWEFAALKPALEDNIEVCMNNKFSTIFNYSGGDSRDARWYSFENDKFYFDFHGYTAKASSERSGYTVENIKDFKAGTAWVPAGTGGVNESITLTRLESSPAGRSRKNSTSPIIVFKKSKSRSTATT